MAVRSRASSGRNEVALVTGASGVIGTWVCRELVEHGIDVVAVDSAPNAPELSEIEHLTFFSRDIGDLAGLLGLARDAGVSLVVHLAAMITQCEQAPSQAVATNVVGTMNMLELQRLTGCRRMVYATSRAALGPIDGAYGAPTFKPVAEDFPRRPITVYGATKLSAESLVRAYTHRYQTDAIGLRFPAMYGPGRLARHGAYAWHSRMIEAAVAGANFEMAAGAREADDVLFVMDAAHAVVLACTTALTSLELLPVYHISSRALVRPTDFADTLRQRYPEWEPRLGTAPSTGTAGFRSFCRFDDQAAQRDIGYSPRYDLASGIDAYIDVLESA